MKACLILAVVGLTFAVIGLIASRADAHYHGRWEGGRGGDEERGGRPWNKKDRHSGHWGGHNSWKSCECGGQCTSNTGTKNIGCFKTRSEYLQCVDTTCTKQSCPDGLLFNFTSKVCEACPTGYHVDAEKRRCVCDQGTTFDFKTRSCTPCPTGSVVTADKCYCNNSVHDRAQNTCRQCPEGATLRGRHCMCNDRTKFWSYSAFQCLACPGVWVTSQERSRGRPHHRPSQICQCEGENQIFNKWTVTCLTCPSNSMVASKRGKSYCDCLQVGEKYDWKQNKCVNKTTDDDDDDDDDDEPKSE